MPREIERRFVVRKLSEKIQGLMEESLGPTTSIITYYPVVTATTELRFRATTGEGMIPTFTLTTKEGWGLSREENHLPLPIQIGVELLNMWGKAPCVMKTRKKFKMGGKIHALDKYLGLPLEIIEVEFASEQEARNYCGNLGENWVEVTDVISFRDKELAGKPFDQIWRMTKEVLKECSQ